MPAQLPHPLQRLLGMILSNLTLNLKREVYLCFSAAVRFRHLISEVCLLKARCAHALVSGWV